MKRILISVVIPAYNEELFLPNLLESLKKQTFNLPYEIIVVNNNSTDNTAKIAKKYGAKVISEKKQGYAFACNKGFYSANGQIIARADADYILPPKWLEKIWQEFAKDRKLIALGGPTYPLESTWLESFFFFPIFLTWMYLLALSGQGFLYPNMATQRSAFLKTGGFNTNITFGEDLDICKRLLRIGKVKLFPSLYIYTSLRRLRASGLYNMITKYTIGNLFAIGTGREATFGLEPIRIVPKELPRFRNPYPYLAALPLVIGSLLFLGLFILSSKQSLLSPKVAYIKLNKFFEQKTNGITPYLSQYNFFKDSNN